MNEHEGPNAQGPRTKIQFRIYSLLIAVSFFVLVAINLLIFLHAQFMEHQFRRSLTEIRPWIWPEGAAALFMLVWIVALIAGVVGAYRIRDKPLKYAALFFAAGALVALVVNAWFGLLEAFKF